MLGVLKKISTASTRISLIYNKSVFLLKKAFVFNLKLYFSSKLKVTNLIYYFYFINITVSYAHRPLFFKIILRGV